MHGRIRDRHFPGAATGSTGGLDTGRLAVAERILTLSQLAAYLDVPRRRLYGLIARIHVFRYSKTVVIGVRTLMQSSNRLLQEFEKEEAERTQKDRRRKIRQVT